MGNKPKVAPGKVRLLTLVDLDARTRAAEHAQSLRNSFLADLDGEAASLLLPIPSYASVQPSWAL
jgi:hypothetical protein